jgi:eukaryotic-like serine/threonine-protein kinase
MGHLIDGRYRIDERLGNGGMAAVYRARDEVLDRPVAIKVLAGPYAGAPTARERIRIEARSIARLWHPNVTNVYDYGEASDDAGACLPYVVMELLPGRTLAQRLADGPVPVQAALRICAEVAGGLAAAHAQGLVHRDVKPSNVMLTPSGAKVMDFGIAAAAGRAEREADGQLLGTPAYLAPERLLADQVLPASDVYALGLLAYRLFANRLPWAAETSTQMLRSHVYVEPAPMPGVRGLPGDVHRILRRCLAKEPAERPSAAEVARILATAAGLPPPADDAAGLPPPDDAAAGLPPPADDAAGLPPPDAAAAGLPPPADDAAGLPPPDAAAAGLPLPPDDATNRLPTRAVGTAGDRRRTRMLAAVGGAAAVALAVLVPLALDEPGGSGNAARDGAGPTPTSSAAPSAGAGPTPTSSATPSAGTGEPAQTPGVTASALRRPATASAPKLPGAPFATLGGVVRVECDGSTARVAGLDPAPGYDVKDYDPGPANEVQVVLLSARNETELKVRCEDGQPFPELKESPQ